MSVFLSKMYLPSLLLRFHCFFCSRNLFISLKMFPRRCAYILLLKWKRKEKKKVSFICFFVTLFCTAASFRCFSPFLVLKALESNLVFVPFPRHKSTWVWVVLIHFYSYRLLTYSEILIFHIRASFSELF